MRLIFIRTALNYYRGEKPSTDIENIDIKFENKNLDDVYSKLSLKELMKKIQTLPSKRRLIFNMVEIEGYSYSEISQILDIAESTIRVQNYKAKQELKRLIEKDNNIDIR
jgi:RNA polymerase sigma-70 factor (ECF subfamily)